MAKFLSKDGKFYMRDGKLLGYTPPPSSPTLAVNSNWYKGSTAKSTITAIEIKDSYTPTGTVTEQWNADVDNSGSIKAYVEGTKLTIAGNGAGKIMANADSRNVFTNFSAATSISGLNLLDTSNVTNMYSMFYYCSALTSVGNLSGWNTSKVVDMQLMFRYCSKLTSLDLSGWNTSKVTKMGNMFFGCSTLTSLDLSNFNTSNVTDMSSMFSDCTALTSLNLSGWDTSKVTYMNRMFYNCNALTSMDVSSFNTTNITDMDYMFYYCKALTSLDLSGWDTSKVTNMMQMFRNCTALTSLDVSGWDTSKVTNMSNIFYSCIRLQFVTLGKDFKFVGTDGYLPVPSSKYITGATGKWYAPNGTDYTPEELAAITHTLATTYSATPPGEII